jgi:hypothetical protein
VIELNYKLDDQAIRNLITEANELEDNEQLFGRLAEIDRLKQDFEDVRDILDKFEADIKGEINSKATALYGTDWKVIKGNGYKINRSATGSKYDIIGEPAAELIEVKRSLKSKLVDEYVKAKGELPEGVGYNPIRGQSIKITVKDDE